MRSSALLLLCLPWLGCAARQEAAAPAPLSSCLILSAAPAEALLERLATGAEDAAGAAEIARILPQIAFCADLDVARVEAELQRAARREARVETALTFHEAAGDLARSRARVSALLQAFLARADAIRARVERLLPEAACAGPGLPAGSAASLAPLGEERALLIDARQLFSEAQDSRSRAGRDGAGERVERLIAPELFHVRFEAYAAVAPAWRWLAPSGIPRLLFVLTNEGAADFLSLPPEERFDDQGRRTPLADAIARRALRRFEDLFLELLDPATSLERRAQLAFSFSNGPRRERWGTYAGALMVDAVVRFGRPGRMREALAQGPGALVLAYREVCGRHAAIPPLSAEVAGLVERLGAAAP
ncbi:MAG: hypothetical protein HY812_09280 [Planctomycetes bacterium]|nr:hypothetical protein [Planctomycetota bacterium]